MELTLAHQYSKTVMESKNELYFMAVTIFPMAESISEILGINPKTGREYVRKLRDAGLVSSGGRGRSAAKMGPIDIANFIIGLMASNSAVDSPEAVRQARNCKIDMITLQKSDNSGSVSWTADGKIFLSPDKRVNVPNCFPFFSRKKLNIPFGFMFDGERPLSLGEVIETMIHEASQGRMMKTTLGETLILCDFEISRPGYSSIFSIHTDKGIYEILYFSDEPTFNKLELRAKMPFHQLKTISEMVGHIPEK